MTSRISKNHTVFNVAYHITWIPKYRKHILKGNIKIAIEKYLLERNDSDGKREGSVSIDS